MAFDFYSKKAWTAVAKGRGGPVELAHVLSLGAPTHVTPGTAFAAARGYAPVRYGFLMRRDLSEPIPDVPLPAVSMAVALERSEEAGLSSSARWNDFSAPAQSHS